MREEKEIRQPQTDSADKNLKVLVEPGIRDSELKQVAFDLLECFPLAFFAVGEDFRIRFCYGKAFHSAKTDPNRLQGESILDYFSERPDILKSVKRALESREEVSVRATWKGRYYSAHFFPYYDQREFKGIHCYVFDHNEVRPPDLRFLTRTEDPHDGIGHFMLDELGRVKSTNAELQTMTGYNDEELKKRDVLGFFSVRYERLILRGQAPERSIVDCSMKLKDGNFIPVRLQWGQIQIEEKTYYDYHVRSLQSERAKEFALDESERRFQSVAESAPLFISITDETGRITYFNSQWLSFRGKTLEEELSKPWIHEMPVSYVDKFEYVLKRALRRKDQFQFECPIKRADGSQRWIFWKAAPRFCKNGDFAGLICTGVDITKQKTMYEGLRSSKIKLERSNAELTQFAYAASHDLQEPLRAINSFTELLAQEYSDQFDDTAKEYFSYITDSAKRMRGLINDILAYSRVTNIDQKFESVSLQDCVDQAVGHLQNKVIDSGARIKAGDLGVIEAHPVQMIQVFQNLFDNAIKYRSESALVIEVATRFEGDSVLISVKDNGIGIDPRFHDKVFSLFQRLHTREIYDGNGIGLSLVKKIVEFHSGHIWFEPNDNQGTVFWIRLPLKQEL